MNRKGYSLVELLVVMVIFLIILGISNYAFERVIKAAGGQSKSVESQIEGVVGLEILRRDIEQAGYALLWHYQNVFPASDSFKEVDVAAGYAVDGIDSTSFNDPLPTNPSELATNAPHAIMVGTTTTGGKILGSAVDKATNPGTDYLVIKSVAVAFNENSKRWSFVNYSGNETSNKSYVQTRGSVDDLQNGDQVISLLSTFSKDVGDDRLLLMNGTTFSYTYSGINPPSDEFKPSSADQKATVYGIHATDPKMPFNRADYYVARPSSSMPKYCNPGTGILYKAEANQVKTGTPAGKMTFHPLVDCVGDMQVMFEMDGSGLANTGPITFSETLVGLTAREVRERMRTVRVYLLMHEGKKDTSFQYPYTDANNVLQVGDPKLSSSGRTWTADEMADKFGPDWRNYRWKVLSVVARPKNLNQ